MKKESKWIRQTHWHYLYFSLPLSLLLISREVLFVFVCVLCASNHEKRSIGQMLIVRICLVFVEFRYCFTWFLCLIGSFSFYLISIGLHCATLFSFCFLFCPGVFHSLSVRPMDSKNSCGSMVAEHTLLCALHVQRIDTSIRHRIYLCLRHNRLHASHKLKRASWNHTETWI